MKIYSRLLSQKATYKRTYTDNTKVLCTWLHKDKLYWIKQINTFTHHYIGTKTIKYPIVYYRKYARMTNLDEFNQKKLLGDKITITKRISIILRLLQKELLQH